MFGVRRDSLRPVVDLLRCRQQSVQVEIHSADQRSRRYLWGSMESCFLQATVDERIDGVPRSLQID